MTDLANIEAEQNLLGGAILNNDVVDRAAGIVKSSDFSDPVHGMIWDRIIYRRQHDMTADAVTLGADLAEYLTDLGGKAYLVRLAGAAYSLFAWRDHAALIASLARKRRLAETLTQALADLNSPDRDAAAILSAVEAFGLTEEARGKGEIVTLTKALSGALRVTMDAQDGNSGMPTGINRLDEMIGGFRPGDLVILGGRPGMGKAQPLWSPVLMQDGTWRPMGDLRFGDKIASVDGEASTVVAVHDRGSLPAFRVTFSDGRSTVVAADHLWRVRSRHWDSARVLTTDAVAVLLQSKRHQKRLSIDMISGEFGGGELPVDPYILGVVLGDGCTRNALSITSADPEVLDAIAARLPDEMEVRAIGGSRYGYGLRNRVRGGGNRLIDALRGLGVMGVLGENKSIPAAYMRASRRDRLELLRGLMDTDGWAETFGAVRFCSTSRALAYDVAYLVRSLGGSSTIRSKTPICTKPNGERVEGQTAYIVGIRHEHPEEFFHLSRKSDRCRRGRNSTVRLNILSVEPCGSEVMRCITVSHPSSLYVTDDFIVTHNSSVALAIAINAARAGFGVAFASLEMPVESLALRAISAQSDKAGRGVAYADALRGNLTDEDFEQVRWSAQEIVDLPVRFIPPETREIGEIHSAVKRCAKQFEAKGIPFGAVIIDYLQLLRASRQTSRFEAITEISIALKQMALTLKVPVIALSQLSRGVEQREDRRPIMSDLRESGQLEQDADVILFCYREEYYLQRDRPDGSDPEELADWQDSMAKAAGWLDIIVAKQRMGETGGARVRFEDRYNSIRGQA